MQRGEWNDEEECGEGAHERPSFTERVTVEDRIEDREHAPLELRAARHGERGERRLRRAMIRGAERANHGQELFGVHRRSGAVTEHVVVARVLALELHAAVGDPDERIEPEQRERELAGELRERVEPLHVRHLVHEHEAPALFGPAVGVVGQQHDWIDDAPRDGNAELVAAQERERPVDLQRTAHTLRERKPASVVHARALARELRDHRRANRESRKDDHCTEEPEREENRASGEILSSRALRFARG